MRACGLRLLMRCLAIHQKNEPLLNVSPELSAVPLLRGPRRKYKRGPNEIPACCMPLAEPSANARNVGRVGTMVLTQSRTVKPLDAAMLAMTVDDVAFRD